MEELEGYIKKIEKVISGDQRYRFEAYSFVLAGLHHTVSKLEKPRHVTGPELLGGIKEYATEQFGRMARLVLNYWGVHKTEDIGNIVFTLVDAGVLRKQPEDRIEDFRDIFSFEEAFDRAALEEE